MYVVMFVSVIVLSEWLLGKENDVLYGGMVLISGGWVWFMVVLFIMVIVSDFVVVVSLRSMGF